LLAGVILFYWSNFARYVLVCDQNVTDCAIHVNLWRHCEMILCHGFINGWIRHIS